MADLVFRRIPLTAEQVRRDILPGDFEPKNRFYPPTHQEDGGGVLDVRLTGGGVFPLKMGEGRRAEAYVSVTQWLHRTKAFSVNAAGVGVVPCGQDLRSCAETAEKRANTGAVDSKGLGTDVVVWIAYGDWNADGKTDVLAALSSGAAILYEQE